MPCSHREVEVLLKKLEEQMRTVSLWSDMPPSQQALSSRVPFAYDQMPFEQWLQFIFIPKMMALIEGKKHLPDKLVLLPMAEKSLTERQGKTKVLAVISQIDRLFRR